MKGRDGMFTMEYAGADDLAVWRGFDRHIADGELLRKMEQKRCYIIKENATPVGVLRYNLFWDEIPFVTLLYFAEDARGKGYGRRAMEQWETEMRALGFSGVMTSTQADENAQHFYRKLGYRDAGCLLPNVPQFAQPAELFFMKAL